LTTWDFKCKNEVGFYFKGGYTNSFETGPKSPTEGAKYCFKDQALWKLISGAIMKDFLLYFYF